MKIKAKILIVSSISCMENLVLQKLITGGLLRGSDFEEDNLNIGDIDNIDEEDDELDEEDHEEDFDEEQNSEEEFSGGFVDADSDLDD